MIIKGGDVKPGGLHPARLCRTTAEIESRYARSRVKAGDIVIAIRGGVGDTALVPADVAGANLTQDAARIAPRRGVNSRWLHYSLRSLPVQMELSARTTGATIRGLNIEELDEVRIPKPPPPEKQRAIADYLDAETARIDALIAKKQQLIQLLEERLETEMTELACGRLEGKPLCESGVDWIGRIPVEWQVSRLNKVARLESGHTPSRSREDLWVNTDKPWITLNDVGTLAGSEFISETRNLISDAGLAASSARMLPAHTVVLSRDATIGRVGIMTKSMATSQHFAAWVCSSDLRPRFLWLLLRYAMQPSLASFDDGATLRTIGMPHVRRFMVPLPPVEQQDSLIALAAQRRAAMQSAGGRLAHQLRLLVEHRHALITAVVTGEFRDPSAA
jgi:type I restriction enzyme S subunit